MLEIAQCILHEIIKYNSEYDKKIILDNKEIRFTNITPRLFLITGYNVVLLKPSAYMSNVDAIIKKELRNSLTNEFDNKLIKWYDGKDILWNSKMFNLVHTTDNPCEAALHFLAGYPEYQVMTRFMYPNPKILKLEREKVNGRI